MGATSAQAPANHIACHPWPGSQWRPSFRHSVAYYTTSDNFPDDMDCVDRVDADEGNGSGQSKYPCPSAFIRGSPPYSPMPVSGAL